jgi:serine phosphatase RsbU (regulator of sigma subunit)
VSTPGTVGPARFELFDPRRLAALAQTGLTAAPDPGMDTIARLVRRLLDVPVAFVSLLEAERQILPGAAGLTEPWSRVRATPLSHAPFGYAVGSAEPVALEDTRADPRTQVSPAIDELGMVSYAAMPLTDGDGRLLGSLCAIDHSPRAWSRQALSTLHDLAAACTADLRLRILSRRAEELAAQADAERERTRLLLRAAEELADTHSLLDVRARVSELLVTGLTPGYLGLSRLQGRTVHRVPDDAAPGRTAAIDREHPSYPVDSRWPGARAVRENRMVVSHLPDGSLDADAAAAYAAAGLRTVVCVPLPGVRGTVGVLELGWDGRHEPDSVELAALRALAGYTAQAVERALYLDERVAVARTMQEAMLTDLPAVAGLELAAHYRPAATREMVGGDWYDAYLLPTHPGCTQSVAVTIGDVTGHDMHAATLMGQIRSMLRQSDLDHPGAPPSEILAAFEHANDFLDLEASGSLVHAHLHRNPAGWLVNWTNAGHPPPLLACPGGPVKRLKAHGIMLYPGLVGRPRGNHRRPLPPGSTLLLYTDGLVERRREPIDARIDALAEAFHHARDMPLPQLPEYLSDHIAGPAPDDDIAVLALRT